MAKPTPPQGRTDAPEHFANAFEDAMDAQKHGAPALNGTQLREILALMGADDRLYSYTNRNADPHKLTLEYRDGATNRADTLGELTLTDDGLAALKEPRANVYVGPQPSSLLLNEARRQKEFATISTKAIQGDAKTLAALDYLDGTLNGTDAEGKPIAASARDLEIFQNHVRNDVKHLDTITAVIANNTDLQAIRQQMQELGARYSGTNDTEPQGHRTTNEAAPAAPGKGRE